MKKGKVKFFDVAKHFGFIQDIETGEEVFVHQSGLVTPIHEGDTVEYEVIQGKKGMNAVNVKVS
jgi:CspA family cold shock protein